ncbi:MAG: serine protease [Arenicella sp.]|jgi:serine protease
MKLKNSVIKSSLYGMTLAMLSQTATAMLPELELSTAKAKSSKTTYLAQPRFIVKYKSNNLQLLSNGDSLSSQMSTADSVSTQLSVVAGQRVKYIREMATGAHVVQPVRGMSKREMMQIVSSMQSDSNIEEDRILQIMTTPSDPQYNNQWH